METCIKSIRKCNGTLKLYFNSYGSMWTISWTPYLTAERSNRKIVREKMAAHIIANVHDIHFYYENGVDVRTVTQAAVKSIDNMLQTTYKPVTA